MILKVYHIALRNKQVSRNFFPTIIEISSILFDYECLVFLSYFMRVTFQQGFTLKDIQ